MNFNFSCYTDLLGLILSTFISLTSLSFAFIFERCFAREKVLDWQVFPFCSLKVGPLSLYLDCFQWEIWRQLHLCPSIWNISFFPLATFKIFFFIIDFDQFKDVWVYSFCQIWEILAIIFSNFLSVSPFFQVLQLYVCQTAWDWPTTHWCLFYFI